MTTLVKADDKSRIPIRGTKAGCQYLVTPADGGWWVRPAPEFRTPRKPRSWKGPKKDLSEYLDMMAASGFFLEPIESAAQPVGPCRFSLI